MVDIINENNESKKFCILTTGRAGSTSLMRVLEGNDDIAVPNKNIHCPSNELIHHRRSKRNMANMSKLVNKQIKTNQELLKYFFEYKDKSRVA